MNYRIEDIPPEGLSLRGERGRDWLQNLFQGQEKLEIVWLSPVSYDIRISRSGARVLAEGFINLAVQLACSRCLEHVNFAMSPGFSFYLSPAPDQMLSPELELQPEDLNIEFYTDDAIDIGQVIRTQIILTLPFNPLCKEDCKGLCPYCGMNKNYERCECSEEVLINPKLSILKDFFKK